jgi:hypothetical protein
MLFKWLCHEINCKMQSNENVSIVYVKFLGESSVFLPYTSLYKVLRWNLFNLINHCVKHLILIDYYHIPILIDKSS